MKGNRLNNILFRYESIQILKTSLHADQIFHYTLLRHFYTHRLILFRSKYGNSWGWFHRHSRLTANFLLDSTSEFAKLAQFSATRHHPNCCLLLRILREWRHQRCSGRCSPFLLSLDLRDVAMKNLHIDTSRMTLELTDQSIRQKFVDGRQR